MAVEATSVATKKAQGDFYIFPDLPLIKSDFYVFKVAVKMSDLSLKSSVYIKPMTDNLDKKQWENFWQLFNLTQSDCKFLDDTSKPNSYNADSSTSKYDCLVYHDESLHEVIKQLIDNEIAFNQDGGFFIEHNGVYAEAMLGFEEKKFFIKPLSIEDKRIFEQAGFTEINPTDFTIKAIQ